MKFVFFLLIFKLIDLSLYFIGHNYSLNEAYSYGNISRLYSGKINANIVFFGSSRTYLHINPEVIENITNQKSYNLGKDGTNIEQALFTLEEYLIHNSSPSIVVFDADALQLDENTLLFEKKYFKKFVYFSKHTMDIFNYSILKKLAIYLVPSQTFSNKGIGDLVNGFLALWPGYNREYSDKTDFGSWLFIKGAHLKKGTQEYTINKNPHLFEIDISRKNVYNELITLQKKHNFSLVLLETPSQTILEPEVYKNARLFFKTIAADNTKVHYLSFYDDQYFLSQKELWYNVAHLNILGANELSKRIFIELVKKCSVI